MNESQTASKQGDRSVGNRKEQDQYTQAEFADIVRHFPLEQGKYELDVGRDGRLKFSVIKKRWIQNEDLQAA